MIDAYEIGIQLALQDDVSAGLEVISRGLAEVDRAIDATSARLAELTAAEAKAGLATSAAAMRASTGPIGKDDESSREPEIAMMTPVASAAAPPRDNQPSAASTPKETEASAPAKQSPLAAVAAPQQSSSMTTLSADQATLPSTAPKSEQHGSSSMVHVQHSIEPVAPAVIAHPEPGPGPQGGRTKSRSNAVAHVPTVSSAPSVAPKQADRADPAGESRQITASVVGATAPSKGRQAQVSNTASSQRGNELSREVPFRAAAPWSGIENRLLSPRPAAASDRAAAPRARQQDGSAGLTGTVMLDGHLVGYWLAEEMAKEASRPPSGTSFFDPRQSPAWTASGSL